MDKCGEGKSERHIRKDHLTEKIEEYEEHIKEYRVNKKTERKFFTQRDNKRALTGTK